MNDGDECGPRSASGAAPRRARAAVLLAVAAVVCIASYWPGLHSPFYFDSVERIVRNDSLQARSLEPGTIIRAAYAGERGYPERGIANLSFALNHYLSGGRFVPFHLKLTNVLIHVVNAVLVFGMLLGVSGRWCRGGDGATGGIRWLSPHGFALMVSVLWMLHPIAFTSVVYAVQRMTSLSATFVLLGLVLFLNARRSLHVRPVRALVLMGCSLVIGAGIGFFAKQNAVLILLYGFLLEWFFFRRDTLPGEIRQRLRLFYLVVVALPVALALMVMLLNSEAVLAGYQARNFDLVERLLTQARVLVFYLGQLLLPLPGQFSLYHDDIAISTGVFSPPATAACLVLWVLVLLRMPSGWRRRAPWAFAVSWYLAGHALESSVLPLEMVFEHRNYLPGLGILAGAGYYLARWADRLPNARRVAPLVAVALSMVLGIITATRAIAWQAPESLMTTMARAHPGSYRALMDRVSATPGMLLAERAEILSRAALLREDAVKPLLDLGGLLAAQGPQVEPVLASRVAGVSGAPVDTRERDVLRDALLESIGTRLREFATETDTVISLVALTDCVISAPARCGSWAGPLGEWLDEVIRGQRTTGINMTALHLSRAKLSATTGRMEDAVDHVRQVARWTPDSVSYRLLQAEFFARVGRVDDCEDALDGMEAHLGFRVRQDPKFVQLRRFVARARAAASK